MNFKSLAKILKGLRKERFPLLITSKILLGVQGRKKQRGSDAAGGGGHGGQNSVGHKGLCFQDWVPGVREAKIRRWVDTCVEISGCGATQKETPSFLK